MNKFQQVKHIAIVGETGSGKSILLKEIASELAASGRKILILDTDPVQEYKQITANLGGEYLDYAVDNIDYKSLLTTIFLPVHIKENVDYSYIDLISKYIKEADNHGVEVILIDEAAVCLSNCCSLLSNIRAQLIVGTQYLPIEQDIAELFNVLIFLGRFHYHYSELFDLYNIDQSSIKQIESQQNYEFTIINNGKSKRDYDRMKLIKLDLF